MIIIGVILIIQMAGLLISIGPIASHLKSINDTLRETRNK